MSRYRVPDDPRGVEHWTVDAGSRVVWLAARALTREDDAAVAPAETAPHDLFERNVARAAVRRGQLGARAHHRRRAAHEQLYRLTERSRGEGRLERYGHSPVHAAAAIFGRQDDIHAERFEQLHAV